MSKDFEAENTALLSRLEAVIVRERFKDERIKELEGIIRKLQHDKIAQAEKKPSDTLTVVHQLSPEVRTFLRSLV